MDQSREVDPLNWLDARCSEPSVHVRESILVETQRVLRGRRRLRLGARLAAFIVVYLMGMASVDVWRIVVRQDAVNQEPVVADGRHASDQPALATMSNAGPTVKVTNPALPKESAKTQFEVMRDAADRVWEKSGDIALATRLYARAVRRASAAEIVASAHDNWLLLSLKEARIQEMKHANASL